MYVSNENNQDVTAYFDDIQVRHNHTPVADGSYAIRINNRRDAKPQPVGASLTLRVFSGDTIDASVYAKYEDFDVSKKNQVLPALGQHLLANFSMPAGTREQAQTLTNLKDSPGLMGLAGSGTYDEKQPRVYLNYMLYDQKMQLVDFGYKQVSDNAKDKYEQLKLDNIIAKQPGFIYLYVSNENNQDVTAYFDDIQVKHKQTSVAVARDLYPFGLVMDGREIKRKNWRYHNEFSERDKESGYDYYQLRMYDPIVGRWTSIDPKRQYASGYVGMGNNPTNGGDPDGGAWKPGKNGNLVAEKGDNALTLSEYLGVSFDKASEIFNNYSNWDGGNLTNGLTDVRGHTLSFGSDYSSTIETSSLVINFVEFSAQTVRGNPQLSSVALRGTNGIVSGISSVGGYALAIAGVGYDSYKLYNEEIGFGEFTYNTTATTLSTISAVVTGSSGVGLGVAIVFISVKEGYNSIHRINEHYDRVYENSSERYKGTSWRDFKNDFNYWGTGGPWRWGN